MTRIVYAAAYLQLSFDASLFARLRSAASAFGNSVGNDVKATQASVFSSARAWTCPVSADCPALSAPCIFITFGKSHSRLGKILAAVINFSQPILSISGQAVFRKPAQNSIELFFGKLVIPCFQSFQTFLINALDVKPFSGFRSSPLMLSPTIDFGASLATGAANFS